MTETENNGNNSELTPLEKDIIKQVSYYFGDFNLPRDKFLQEQLKDNEEGWIDIEIMLKFQRLNKLSSEGDVILKAFSKAGDDELIEVDLENKKLRRKTPAPPKEDEESSKAKTVYLKGFEKEKTTLDDLLTFFNEYEGVIHVNRRTWLNRKDNSRNFKGSVFVTFKTQESAKKFMDLESVKNPEGEELIRKWQADYFSEREKEFSEKKAKKSQEKKAKNKMVEESNKLEEEPEEENKLPKGATLFMKNFKDDTMREHIKEGLKAQFEVDPESIAFVDFEKGQTQGYIRFTEENAAQKLAEKIKDFKVKEAEIEVKLLEGDEEKEYLDKALAVMKARKDKNRGHKRRHGGGGRGGRGGKRGRR